MTPSIRTFLLINLLLSITLITSLAIIGNLFLEHKDLQRHLNAQLTFAALTIESFISDDTEHRNLSKIQQKIDAFPEMVDHYYNVMKKKHTVSSEKLIQFQIWDRKGKLLLKSHSAPNEPLANSVGGFTTNWVNNQLWHAFSHVDERTGLRVDVGERSDFREELEGKVTQDSIFIMLITYPFLGLLIWIIVGRGLDSIRQVTNELSQRAPSNLQRVELEEIPTEIEPLVLELNKLFQRLQEAFEREKRFASDAAHELRTPLAALQAQTQVALKVKDPNELREVLEKILIGVNRSSHVVQQLLTMSRMVPQTTIQELSAIDIIHEAKTIIADLVPTALTKNTELELIAPESPMIIQGNATAIGILFRNLLDNAIRYSPEGSRVQMRIFEKHEYVIVQVADNGPGIPKELRQRVFERFFRIVGNTTTGSGLGLGIVQQVVELHHAKMEMGEPETGSGLVVTVKFRA